MNVRAANRWSKFLFSALAAAAAAGNAADWQTLSRWRFSRDGGKNWESVSVPHDWAIAGPFDPAHDMQKVKILENGEERETEKTGRTGALPWLGRGEYTCKVKVPEGVGYAALVFDGVMSECEVYIDGKKSCEWKHGYNAFIAELPSAAGEYEVNVKAFNRPQSSRWYPGAGIYRRVKFVTGAETGLAIWGNSIYSPDLETVKVTSEFRGSPGKVVYRMFDGGKEIASSETGVIKGKFEPWSPESPKLYGFVTEVYDTAGRICDRTEEKIGIRTLEYGRDGFKLNGRKRKFQGVCLHHDLGPLGAAFSADAFRRQLALLKEMGCDSIRTAHNMPAEEQLEICDEMGIMVMAESFDSWAFPKCKNGYNLFFDEWWRRDLENLVKKCRNHPSVVMWSIGNEITEQTKPEGLRLSRELQAWCRRFDPDPERKVTQGLSWMPGAIKSGVVAAMEVPSVTYRLPFYKAIYEASPHGFMLGSETASTISSRAEYFFPVEVSSWPHHRNLQCSSYDVEYCPWSNLPDDDWAVQDDNPWTIGEFVWTGFDYLGEPTPYDNYWPSRSSYFGIFDLAGIPKDRYWLYRSRWNVKERTCHLLPHWTWPGREGKVTPVYCYTDSDEAELFVNGRSQGRRRKDPSSRLDRYRLRWNDVVYEPGELKVIAYGADGKVVSGCSVRTAGKAAAVKLEKRRFGKLLFVEATVVDADGNWVPGFDGVLKAEAKGALGFKAICNGDATSVESFTVPRMKAFHGKLVAVFEGAGDEASVAFED
jgi:beta-galactosidase